MPSSPPAREPRSGLGPGVLLCWCGLGAAVLVGLAGWQGHAYWEYSDGVYSLSARQLLGGQALYRDFAGAQPPPLYYLAAAVLAVSDGPAAIRIVMALCEACLSLTVLAAVRRLTGSPAAALAAALAALVTPWALREHAQLLPETVAAPLIMGAALAGRSRGASAWAGALGAAAAAFKLAFVVPALVIVVMTRRPRQAWAGFLGLSGILAVGFLVVFGEPLWTDVVRAQAEAGRASPSYVLGLWLQAGWNLLALVLLAGLAWPRRQAIEDPDLARRLLGASLGTLLLLGTLLKHGSYLTVMVVAEPPLLCLAACGAALTLRRAPGSGAGRRGPRRGVVVVALALGLGVGQSASLIASPANPTLFIRPLAASGPGQVLSSAQVGAAVAVIRRCPSSTAYAGPPYLAFLAARRIAGSQPDQFIIEHAPALAEFRRAATSDPSICPVVTRISPP